jgi:general secretion pathway protein G
MRKTRLNEDFKRSASGGFSLIELMIVIIILGLLASLVMPNIMGKSEEAKQKLVCIQMKNIGETLKLFKLDNGTYPETEEGLEALVSNPDPDRYPNYSKSGYFENGKIPKDSWQSPFIYLTTEEGKFDLISLGADRKEGGEGDGADIRFSECQ